MRNARALAIVAATAGAAFGIGAYLSAHGGNVTAIHGCVDQRSGALRVVAPTGTCRANEAALDWNITGPPGPQGVQGAAGATGATGAQGSQGEAGEGLLTVVGANGAPAGIWAEQGLMRVETADGWIYLRVTADGKISGGTTVGGPAEKGPTFLYTEPDCGGTAYILRSTALIPAGILVDDNVYYQGPSAGSQTIASQSSPGSTSCFAVSDGSGGFPVIGNLAEVVSVPLSQLLPPGPYQLMP